MLKLKVLYWSQQIRNEDSPMTYKVKVTYQKSFIRSKLNEAA